MKRYIFAGLFIFLGCVAVFAPAGIVARILGNVTNEVVLLEPRGTVWNGRATLLAGGENLGLIDWQLDPWSIFMINPTTSWRLKSTDLDLYGNTRGVTSLNVRANGEIDLNVLQTIFNRYDMAVSGIVTLDELNIGFDLEQLDTQRRPSITSASGELIWSGGPVRYILSGILSESILPKLHVKLSAPEQKPTANVFAEGEPIQLMQAQLTTDGFVKIGITKFFTKLLNRPWPGSDPDHVIVLEVEEQLL